jgi:hypothetical protein
MFVYRNGQCLRRIAVTVLPCDDDRPWIYCTQDGGMLSVDSMDTYTVQLHNVRQLHNTFNYYLQSVAFCSMFQVVLLFTWRVTWL